MLVIVEEDVFLIADFLMLRIAFFINCVTFPTNWQRIFNVASQLRIIYYYLDISRERFFGYS